MTVFFISKVCAYQTLHYGNHYKNRNIHKRIFNISLCLTSWKTIPYILPLKHPHPYAVTLGNHVWKQLSTFKCYWLHK